MSKGSKPRPRSEYVTDEQVARNWERTFGKKKGKDKKWQK